MEIKQCQGEGAGHCKRCTDNGKWNSMWMCFLYEIDGVGGCYCYEHAKEIIKEKM